LASPGLTRSGEKQTKKSLPSLRPVFCNIGRKTSLVVVG